MNIRNRARMRDFLFNGITSTVKRIYLMEFCLGFRDFLFYLLLRFQLLLGTKFVFEKREKQPDFVRCCSANAI